MYPRPTTSPTATCRFSKWYMNPPPYVVKSSGQPAVCSTSPGTCFAGSTSHNSLRPIPHVWGSRSLVERVLRDHLLAEMPACAFGEQRVLAHELDATLIVGRGPAILADAHVARRDAAHGAALVVKHFGAGEPGEDFDAQRLGLLAEPAHDIAEAHDVVAIVDEAGGQQPVREWTSPWSARAARSDPRSPAY